MQKADLQALQRANRIGRTKLHDEARTLINFLNDQPEEDGPFDVTGANWPTWKTYIAMHKGAESLVGTGAIAVTGEFIDGTQDPNRGGKKRMDIVIRHADGGYVRIHPGREIREDAEP